MNNMMVIFFLKALGDQILFVNRPDKKKILFFNDKSCQFSVDEGKPFCADTSKYIEIFVLFVSFSRQDFFVDVLDLVLKPGWP